MYQNKGWRHSCLQTRNTQKTDTRGAGLIWFGAMLCVTRTWCRRFLNGVSNSWRPWYALSPNNFSPVSRVGLLPSHTPTSDRAPRCGPENQMGDPLWSVISSIYTHTKFHFVDNKRTLPLSEKSTVGVNAGQRRATHNKHKRAHAHHTEVKISDVKKMQFAFTRRRVVYVRVCSVCVCVSVCSVCVVIQTHRQTIATTLRTFPLYFPL